MHPRIILLAISGVVADLLCLVAAAIVLLTNNPWLDDLGPTRFWFAVLVVAAGLVPIMYCVERETVARDLGNRLERVDGNVRAWSGVERSAHTA